MKKRFLKLIKKLLRLVGLNIARAKRKNLRPKSEVKLSDYMGETEWQNTPPIAVPVPNPGKTHYVGDGCPGEHGVSGCDDHEITRTEHESKR